MKQRTRIAFCIDAFNVGGSELNAVRTAEALDRDCFDLHVFHLQKDGPLHERYRALDIPMTHVPITSLYAPFTLRQGARLARDLRTWGAQVLHTHDVYTNIFAVPSARLSGNCRVIASRRWWNFWPRTGLQTLNRLSYRLAHKILVNCESVGHLIEQVELVPAQKIAIIHNFLDDHAFQAVPSEVVEKQRAEWNIAHDVFVIGIVARLVPEKNHAFLLHAIAMLDDTYHVVLVGDGHARQDLEKLAISLNIDDRIHFVGEIRSRVNLHTCFDVSVLCSVSEGFPNTIIEALAAARPVIATPVGGVTDVIIHNETGLLTPLGDPESLAQAIKKLRTNRDLSATLGKAGQSLARARFDRRIVIDELSTLYESLAHSAA